MFSNNILKQCFQTFSSNDFKHFYNYVFEQRVHQYFQYLYLFVESLKFDRLDSLELTDSFLFLN